MTPPQSSDSRRRIVISGPVAALCLVGVLIALLVASIACVGGGGGSSGPLPPMGPTFPPPTLDSPAAEDSQVVLTWSYPSLPPSDGFFSYRNYFTLFYSTTSGVTPTGSGIDVSSPYRLTGLTNGTTYYFVVRHRWEKIVQGIEVIQSGESFSNEVSAAPRPATAPPGPPTLRLGTTEESLIGFNWTSVPDTTSYNLYYSTSSGVTTATGTKVTGVIAPYKQTGLIVGVSYYFVVTAVNSAGESPVSNEVTATLPHWYQQTSIAPWEKRQMHASVVFNNKLWVLGGEVSASTYEWMNMNDVWSSPDGTSWTQSSSSANWSSRYGHSSVVFNAKIWVIGGEYVYPVVQKSNGSAVPNNGNKKDVWSSSDGVTWSQVTSSAPWSARGGHTCVTFNNKMWVIGGAKTNNNWVNGIVGGTPSTPTMTAYADVWSSNDGANWIQETVSAPWGARTDHASVVFNNKMWVMGGVSSGLKNDVWSSADGVTWTLETTAAPWTARSGHTSVVFNGKLWVIGGAQRSDVWSSTEGVNWTQETDAPWTARSRHTSAVFNSKLWVIGGRNMGGGSKNDVWSFQ